MSYKEKISKEQTKQSKYSPGLIELDEIVARVLFSPKHYHNGEILPTAFSPAIFKGLSVLRKKYNFCECLSRTIEILEKDGKNEYCGYAYANVKDIKNIIENNYRIFYLLDSATKDRIGHADIFPIII
ncbi:MAG: hypothetical protein JJV95_03570 [Sulfurospirillum sp.]|nr:hypothetical protein [Sulfurospirillum sp.]